ncbi:hypothetical protein Vi05172_g1615 [Venturia inaequalis]|nr:hypothetical protein Vi05172_g1615 [Venturia inaequalis]
MRMPSPIAFPPVALSNRQHSSSRSILRTPRRSSRPASSSSIPWPHAFKCDASAAHHVMHLLSIILAVFVKGFVAGKGPPFFRLVAIPRLLSE